MKCSVSLAALQIEFNHFIKSFASTKYPYFVENSVQACGNHETYSCHFPKKEKRDVRLEGQTIQCQKRIDIQSGMKQVQILW